MFLNMPQKHFKNGGGGNSEKKTLDQFFLI